MTLKPIPIAAMVLGYTLAVPGSLGSASAPPGKDIPPSEATEHEADITYLIKLAGWLGPISVATWLRAKFRPTGNGRADANRLQPEQESIRQTHDKLTMASSP